MFHPSLDYSQARPFKIFISLLDKWEIGSPLTDVLVYDAFKAINLLTPPRRNGARTENPLQVLNLAQANRLMKSMTHYVTLTVNRLIWQNYAGKGELNSSITCLPKQFHQMMRKSLSTPMFESGHSVTSLAYPRLSRRNGGPHAAKNLRHFASDRSMIWSTVRKDAGLSKTVGSLI